MRTPVSRSFFSLFVLLLVAIASSADASGEAITGRVLDQSGQPVPRALVSITDGAGRQLATTFTQTDGTFRAAADPSSGCSIAATLGGFQRAVAACGTGQDVKLVLAVAPIEQAVVVTATRGEAPVEQVGASVTVFDAEAIERRQTPMLAEVLRMAPGVTVMQGGGLGNITSIFVRGGESSYTKVLLDGIPLNEPGGPFNFSNVTAEHLDRIELVRGAQSAIFGSDAMSGVVQMFTKRARPGPPQADMMFELGTYDTVRGAAGVSGTAGVLDYSIHGAGFRTGNQEPNNAFENVTLSASAGVEINPRTAVRVVTRAELGRVGVPGQTAFGRADLDASFRRRDGVGGVTFRQQVSDSLTQRATYGLAVSHQRSANLTADPPYTAQFDGHVAEFESFDFLYDSHTNLRRHHATYQVDWRLPITGRNAGTHIDTFAFDWDGERGLLQNVLARSSSRASRNNFGWTFQHQALWARVFATGGLRLEDNDSFGGAVVPRGSIAYVIRRASSTMGDTRVKASAGLGIKEPTFAQSFSPSTSFPGNPNLEPERSRSVEAGIEQHFLHERASVELTWFTNRYRNIISTRTVSFSPFRAEYFNVGLTRARGVELAFAVAPSAALRVTTGYTYLASRILESTAPENAVFRPGQWLFRRPRHSGFTEIAWSAGRLGVDVTGAFTGKRVDSDFASFAPPIVLNDGFALWDFRLSYRVAPHLTLIAAGDNLTDASYMEPLGYLALGRAFRTGARVSF